MVVDVVVIHDNELAHNQFPLVLDRELDPPHLLYGLDDSEVFCRSLLLRRRLALALLQLRQRLQTAEPNRGLLLFLFIGVVPAPRIHATAADLSASQSLDSRRGLLLLLVLFLRFHLLLDQLAILLAALNRLDLDCLLGHFLVMPIV